MFWRTEFIQFLATLAILHYRTILKKRMNSSFFQIILVQFILFFKSSYSRIASMARNWINSVPQTATTTFAFSSVSFLLLCLLLWIDTYLQIRIEVFPLVAGSLVEEAHRRPLHVVESGHPEAAGESAAGVHHQRHLRLPQTCSSIN